MVVLSCSICTKQGKAILSRQFVEMGKTRMEGLLSSFPKLIQKDQHTFVETDQVRYVYQPLDDLYIVLVTNKNSNILQDIDTLHLFSRIVSEYCKSTDYKEITRQRYELILVFDEVISLGYRENINLGQVKTISTMESNDERIQAEIQKNKEREAKEESKRRAQLMDLKKKEQKEAARKGYGDSSMYSQKYSAPVSNYTPPPVQQQPTQSQFSKPIMPSGKGMQLGKKSAANSLFETIKQEEGVTESSPTSPPQQRPAAVPKRATSIASINEEAVHIQVEEKIVAIANRDGGLQSLEINGVMMLKVNDPASSKIKVQLSYTPDSNLQFKTHPNVDKQLWANNNIIALRDQNRPFPVSQPLGILKWRLATKDEAKLPILVNCWPSPTGNGSCDVSVEYELQSSLELTNLVIIIPFVGQVTQPGTAGIGTCEVDRASRTLIWSIDKVDAGNNPSGLLEFSFDSEDISILYPIQVHFRSKRFVDMQVANVDLVEGGSSAYSLVSSLVTDGYEIQ